MMKDKYCFNIPKGGAKSVDILDYCFNERTQAFLLKAGLKKGMKVLEIGCGSGAMSYWIAKQLGQGGIILAIDNSQHQIEAAKSYDQSNNINNINFKCLDAYDIPTLDIKFDLIYCRFVLHHLSKPRAVIHNIVERLKPNGIAVIEEGIVNHAFTCPYNIAFGNERFDIIDRHDNFEGIQRDGNFGLKLWHTLYQAGLNDLSLNIVAPTLTSKTEKSMLRAGFNDSKQNTLENGLSEKEWETKRKQLDELIEDDSAIVGFYQSAQVSGIKYNME